jgi:cytoskeleton protein RodZ
LAPADALVSLKKNVVDSEAASKSFAESLGENPPENIVKNSVNNLANNAVDNSSKNSLVLKIREDSWIEIRKMNRSGTVVSRLFKAGTSETFNVEEPMFMVVGNPTGVDVSFRGVQLEMKRASNSKIARINLK